MRRALALLLLLTALLPLAATAVELCGDCSEEVSSDCCSLACPLCACSLSAKSLVPDSSRLAERQASVHILPLADAAPSTSHPRDILHVPKPLAA